MKKIDKKLLWLLVGFLLMGALFFGFVWLMYNEPAFAPMLEPGYKPSVECVYGLCMSITFVLAWKFLCSVADIIDYLRKSKKKPAVCNAEVPAETEVK